MPRMEYVIRHRTHPADVALIDQFRPESSSHRPATTVRMGHDGERIFGRFDVRDRFVSSVHTGVNAEVWRDSCVECFLMPNEQGYFNFEFNCGGALLCCYITDPARTENGFKAFVRIPPSVGGLIEVRSSLPPRVEPEIVGPIEWSLRFFIPFTVLEKFVGPLGEVAGQTWRGNFFKCAEENSHPHWAAWSPVDEFNFHLPRCFGRIQLSATSAEPKA